MSNPVARAIEQACYVVEETTKGTLVFPSAAAEKIKSAGVVELNQQPNFSESEEVDETLDVLDMFQDMTGPGSFVIPTYFRPSGALGTPPMSKALFESLQGVETINASTSVVYSQAVTKPSFSIWTKKSHTVFFARGACVANAALNIVNKGGSMITFSGEFMEMGWVGTDAVDGAVTSSTSVTVLDGKKFTVGGRVQIGSDTNSGSGYEITAVSGNDLTLGTAVTCADEAVIKGYLPTGHTAVGTPLENKKAVFKIDGNAVNFKTLNLDIGSPVQFQTEEVTTDGYPADYVEDKRAIKGSIDLLLRQDDLKYFSDAKNGTEKDLQLIVGDTSGDKVQIDLDRSLLEVPAINTTAPTISLSIPFTCLGTSGEDSCSITFI